MKNTMQDLYRDHASTKGGDLVSITIDRLRKTRLDQLERAESHGENVGYSMDEDERYAYEEARKAARHGLLVLAIDDVLEPSLRFRFWCWWRKVRIVKPEYGGTA